MVTSAARRIDYSHATPTSRMTPPDTPVDPITDPEQLRDRPDVPAHEETDVLDTETFERVADLGDLTPTGVTNDEGDVLLLRVEDDCTLKIPCSAPEPGQDYADSAREWVEGLTGLDVELEAIEGVWFYEARLDGSDRTASRAFVAFSASVAGDGSDAPTEDVPAEKRPAHVEWTDELPEEAAEPPGTDLFF